MTSNDEKCCRFCYGTESTLLNQLISPCHCSGSIKYAHKDCIAWWLQTHVRYELLNEITDWWRGYQMKTCMMCKCAVRTDIFIFPRSWRILFNISQIIPTAIVLWIGYFFSLPKTVYLGIVGLYLLHAVLLAYPPFTLEHYADEKNLSKACECKLNERYLSKFKPRKF